MQNPKIAPTALRYAPSMTHDECVARLADAEARTRTATDMDDLRAAQNDMRFWMRECHAIRVQAAHARRS